jgi:hypothetical protein
MSTLGELAVVADRGARFPRRVVHPVVLAALASGLPGNAGHRGVLFRGGLARGGVGSASRDSLPRRKTPLGQPTPFALAPNTSDASLLVGYRCERYFATIETATAARFCFSVPRERVRPHI